MFSGWCDLRQDFRTFRLDRIVVLGLTGDVFDDDEAKSLRRFTELDQCDAGPTPMRSRTLATKAVRV